MDIRYASQRSESVWEIDQITQKDKTNESHTPAGQTGHSQWHHSVFFIMWEEKSLQDRLVEDLTSCFCCLCSFRLIHLFCCLFFYSIFMFYLDVIVCTFMPLIQEHVFPHILKWRFAKGNWKPRGIEGSTHSFGIIFKQLFAVLLQLILQQEAGAVGFLTQVILIGCAT